jgi:energy-coupling factor transporter ATP-binding protein EcfA2
MTKLIETLNLYSEHHQHLREEGFSVDSIENLRQQGLIESLTAAEAYKAGFPVAIDNIPVTGGLLFKFTNTFSQLKPDNRDILKDKNGKSIKYLSSPGSIDQNCAYIPDGCEAITEGIKDSWIFSLIGGIPTGAIAGVSHAITALPKNCKHTILFDYDAWSNFKVFISLIRAGVHCGGKVAIIPEIEGCPNAGGCEYFKAGYTAEDYRQLLDTAKTPIDMFTDWFDRQTCSDAQTAAVLAVKSAKLLGELYGYAKSVTIGAINDLLKNSKLSEWNLPLAGILRDSSNTQSALKAKSKAENDTDSRSAAKVVIEIVREKAKLFHSPLPDSTEYAEIPSKTGVFTTHPLFSSEFKSWIVGEYYYETGEGSTSESMNTALATIYAIAAKDSPEMPVSQQRIAVHSGRGYLYLADENQTVIEYSATGWQICENSPVKFVFDKYKAPLPLPRREGKIDLLWNLTRIADSSDRLIVAAILVKGLVPGGTDPILAISGYPGSGKTTTANCLRSLIDPFTKGKVLSKLPESSDHIAIHAQRRRILAIDNVSHISANQSDFLCTVSTGGGNSKRELFSDQNEIILDVQNLIILTSIGNVVTKPDLLERSIVIELARITSEDRESESDLANGFDRDIGEILGGLLNITVAALQHRDTTKCPKYTRMTEFAHLGEGVQEYLEYPIGSLESRMAAGADIANEIAIESSPVASMLRSWISKEETWQGSASDLLNILKFHAKKSELAGTLPKTANSLSGELKKCESSLFQSGISIVTSRTKSGRTISICFQSPSDNEAERSSSSSPPKNEVPELASSDSFSDNDLGDDPQKRSSPIKNLNTPEVISNPHSSDDDPIVDEI